MVKHYSQLLQLWPVSLKAVVVDMDMLVQNDLYYNQYVFTWKKILTYFHFTIAEEMDWDKNGMVNFKEFLFAFTRWCGIGENEDEEEGEEKN